MKKLESMHDPSDTNINAIYDDLLSFGEVTPPAQDILPGAVRARVDVELPTIEKATRQEMLVPSDTQINAMYDNLVCLGGVTPSIQGVLPATAATTGAVEQPINEKATRQEMLDLSDTQMNTMFDELVCLGELTAPAQGILPGAGGATGGLEQPIVEKVIAMYVDATPPAQSILPCAVESSRHAPLQTMAGQAIPKVILNVRPIRRRFPARAIRSPFLHDDIRGGDTFDEYLKLEDGGMNETVEEVFDVMHRGMREEFQRYDHKLFDPTVEKVIPIEEMDKLCLFAEAVQPNWGDNMK
ncbi:hypothetical protein OROGR_017181 [Orobanche gracilis]